MLRNFIDEAQEAVTNAKSLDEINAIVDQSQLLEGNLTFDNQLLYLLIAGAIGVIIFAIIQMRRSSDSNGMILLFAAGVSIMILITTIKNRSHDVANLSQELTTRALFIQEKMRPLPLVGRESTEGLQQRFSEFHRGNYERSIEAIIAGLDYDDEEEVPYKLFHFHYVDKVERRGKDSDGRIEAKSEYRHYDRYGIYLSSSHKNGLIIEPSSSRRGNKGGIYRPASNRFNQNFIVFGDSEMSAARFLTPSIVLEIEALLNHFEEPRLEFTKSGELLLSFSNSDLLTIPLKADLSDPLHFKAELSSLQQPEKLRFALNFLHKIRKVNF